MAGRMRISADGLKLIKSFEGFREAAARLPDGRWTIGYGHVRTAREGLTISEHDAEDLLLYDLKPVEEALCAMLHAPVMQNQFDALVSLVFNISPAQFSQSDILRFINSGDFLAAANGFDLWRKARIHGRLMIVDALVRRRAAEKALFLEHPNGRPTASTPAVRPEIDTDAPAQLLRERADPLGASTTQEDPKDAPPAVGEIAEAVRRLAERTREAVAPAPELAQTPEAPAAVAHASSTEQTAAAQRLRSPDELDAVSRTVAERVSRILERAEHEITERESAVGDTDAAGAARLLIREGLPDFDKPAERAAASMKPGRMMIDDTEIVDLGRDPAELFAEGERQARILNGRSRRIGPVSGGWINAAPWIAVLVLSLLGLLIGAVDIFRAQDAGSGDTPRAAATLIAVFGVMMLMSLYFLLRSRSSD